MVVAMPEGAAPSALPTETLQFDRPEMMLRAVTNMLNAGRVQDARLALGDSLDRYPDSPRGVALLGTVCERQGDLGAALPLFERAVALDPSDLGLHSALIFALDQSPDVTLERAYLARRAFNAVVRVDPAAIPPHTNDRDPERKLKIGYVSNDFKNHSAAFGWAPVLFAHDRQQFELYAYSCTPGGDWATETIKQWVPNWRDAAYWDDDRLEAAIRADGIDVLVDLSGHSSGHRLTVFARKPAPVQITAWGYITGTGLDAMDYMFADDVAVTPDEERWYAEEIVRLPRILTFWASDPAAVGPVLPPPADSNGHLTFGVFNRVGKIQPSCAQAWAEILARVPDARLVVKSPGLDDPGTQASLLEMFVRAGCDVSRLDFLGQTTKNEHMKAYGAIDVALDPSPHGGGMSTLEAAWMGVPTLTLPHLQIPSRIATTIARELGLDYLVASSWPDYVARAVALDGQRDELRRTRRLMREMMAVSAFGDHGIYTRKTEAAYREVWRRWCSGDGPRRGGDA